MAEFAEWFCQHTQRVRRAVDNNPNHTLVELDIDDPNIGSYISDVFDIDVSCWGHYNVNTELHNSSKQQLPWFVRGKKMIRGKTKLRPRSIDPLPLPPDMSPELLKKILNMSTSEEISVRSPQ